MRERQEQPLAELLCKEMDRIDRGPSMGRSRFSPKPLGSPSSALRVPFPRCSRTTPEKILPYWWGEVCIWVKNVYFPEAKTQTVLYLETILLDTREFLPKMARNIYIWGSASGKLSGDKSQEACLFQRGAGCVYVCFSVCIHGGERVNILSIYPSEV